MGNDTKNKILFNNLSNRNLLNYLSNRHLTAHQNWNLTQLARNHPPFLRRLNFMKKLPVHDGCVNTICWNKTGEYILSGSDDRNLCITKPYYLYDSSEDYTVLHKVRTHHLGNIFSASFIPNTCDTNIVSCSSQGPVIVHDVYAHDPSEGLLTYNCHSSTIYHVVPLFDDKNVFLSCSEDKTIRLFDMRVHKSCPRSGTCPHPALIRSSHAVRTIKLHPLNSNLILVGRTDGTGLVYDRRRLPDVSKFSREAAHAERLAGSSALADTFKYRHPMEGVVCQFQVPNMEKYKFTSLDYNYDGSQVLASYAGEYIYLFDHDKSSNVELTQTLPRNPTESQCNEDSSKRSNLSEEQSSRISHIRVRGDWSDTGVNSTPLVQGTSQAASSSSSSGSSGSSRSQVVASVALLEHVARTLRDRSSTPRTPTTDANESDTSMSSSRQQSLHESDLMFDEEDDNAGAEEGTERTIIFANDSDDEEEEEDEDEDEDENENESKKADSRTNSKGKQKISALIREKFRKTLDGLKDKYGSIPSYKPKVRYQGHRNNKTFFKEAIFWGDKYIMSGSDCGRIMVWEKDSAELLMAFQADERVVNRLSPNPHNYVLASSGIDYDVKLWSTQSLHQGPLLVSQDEMNRIVENNEIMLEESRHTLALPPYLFFRVLANLARS